MKQIKLDIQVNNLNSQSWEGNLDAIAAIHSAVIDNRLTSDSEIKGTLTTPIASPSKVSALEERFSDLTINTDDNLMQFEDEEVARVIAKNVGDNYPVSKGEWRNVNTLSTWLQNNAKITYVDDALRDNAITTLGLALQGCSNIEKITTGENITLLYNGSDPFDRCTNLKTFVGLGLADIGLLANAFSQHTSYITTGTSLNTMFFPKVTFVGALATNTLTVNLVDVGKLVTRFGHSSTTNRPIHSGAWTNLVLRATTIPTYYNLGNCTRIFVPSTMIELYQSTEGWNTYTFYAIGGEEWQEEFGSSDEYADVYKYITDPLEQNRIIQAYTSTE